MKIQDVAKVPMIAGLLMANYSIGTGASSCDMCGYCPGGPGEPFVHCCQPCQGFGEPCNTDCHDPQEGETDCHFHGDSCS